MEKIAIIGSPGAGKTTLANQLSSKLGMKKYHLDRLFWYPGWLGKDRETRIDVLQDLVLEKQWIIEGTYLRSSESRLKAADTIIFLDTPLLICLWQIIKRHFMYHGHSRRDIAEGCTDKLTILRILKVLLFPFQKRMKLETNLHKFPSDKVIRLNSAKEVKGFLAQPELYPYENRRSVKKRPVLGRSFIIIFVCLFSYCKLLLRRFRHSQAKLGYNCPYIAPIYDSSLRSR